MSTQGVFHIIHSDITQCVQQCAKVSRLSMLTHPKRYVCQHTATLYEHFVRLKCVKHCFCFKFLSAQCQHLVYLKVSFGV